MKMLPSTAEARLFFSAATMVPCATAITARGRESEIQQWKNRCKTAVVGHRPAAAFLSLMITIYVVTFSGLSIVRHMNFHSHNDLAIHAQVVWNTTQGRWFETTLLEDRQTNYLGHHFSPALLLLMPFYLLWPDASVLLVLQTILLALGVVPVYAYAWHETRSKLVAASISATYLLFPALHYANLFDFHEIVLAVPLLSFTAYFLLTKRYRLFFVFLFLSLLVKEEVAFVAVAFAFYILFVQRRYRLGMLVLFLAIGWGYLIMGMVMPTIAGHTYFPSGRYGYLGSSFGEVARSMLLDPLLVLRHLLVPAKLELLLQLLVPVGLLPVLGFDTLILALPTTLYILLSDYEPQYSIYFHYTAPLIPLLFMAAVTGVERIVRWKGRSVTVAVSACILVTGVSSYLLHGPGPLARHFNQDDQYSLGPHLASGYEALATIPSQASVMTLEEFAPHLASREQIYIENENYLPVEYIFQEYTARTATPRYPALVPQDRDLVYPYYETVFDKDGYWVRRYQDSIPISHELGVSFEDKVTLLAYQWRDQGGLPLPVLKPGESLDLIVAWRAEGRLPERYAFFVHVLDQNFHRWAQVDQEVERGVYPTTLWEPGMVVADHYRLSVPWGTPPGDYQVLIGAYSLDSEQRLRPTCNASSVRDNALLLGPVRVTKADPPPPPEAVSPQHRLDMRWNDELELVGYDLGMTDIQPGGTIPLVLTWRALAAIEGEYTIAPILGQADGATRLQCFEEPVGLAYRPDLWEVSEVVRDWHDLHVPPETPPGLYEISLEVLDTGKTIGEVNLGRVEIQGRPHQFDVPEMQHTVGARVGQSALFLGYDLEDAKLRPGDTLKLSLYWQALEEMQVSYTVFAHLLDADQRIWGQMDTVPGRGAAATTSWLPGEVISDRYEIAVSPEAPPGEYVVEIGMYDATTGERLPAFSNGLALEEDRVLLGTVQVIPRD